MANHNWVWPNGLKKMPRVISAWGSRIHPVTGKRTFHYGTDFAKGDFPDGYNRAITDGVVEKVGVVKYWEGGGNGVWIRNYDGSLTKWFHGKNGSILVKKGQKVTPGQPLSKLGDTGTAAGVHCHLEHSPNGEPGGQVDPVPYLKKKIESSSPAGGGGKPIDPPKEESEVIPYHREDALARKTGRKVAPNTHFYLHTDPKAATYNAVNVIGAKGAYDITSHIYATGTPGDSIYLTAVVQSDPGTNKAKNSNSYTEIFTFGPNGVIQGDANWKFDFSAKNLRPIAVYIRAVAPATNKGTVSISVLDSDAHCYKV